jgi:alkanesulfonate monooxygenase SsuD/methylene tetrahydromethanopterin reductase-like flavin-dependent oxidoreductase (luciferase family)
MEFLRAMKTLWTEENPSFTGRHVSFPPVYSYPKPVQRPHPPILIGAGSSFSDNLAILKRVAEFADGWLPVYLSPAQMAEELGKLKELCAATGRDFSKLDITLLVPAVNLGVGAAYESLEGIDADPRKASEVIAEYAAVGVNRIIVGLVDLTVETGLKDMENAAKGLGLI